VHVTLSQLRGLPGASATEAAWAEARASQTGWLTGPEADAAACDATVVPIVTGHVDWLALDRLTEAHLAASLQPPVTADHTPGRADHTPGTAGRAGEAGGTAGRAGASDGADGCANSATGGCGCTCGRCACHERVPLTAATRQRLGRALLGLAAGALSGPGGLAAQLRAASLRTGLDGRPLVLDREPLASVSLPLDVGPAIETIPAHLRRAVTTRHPHCAFPGCEQPASVCDIHHIIPRSRGGPTSLANLVTMCVFHHLTVIHRWGWQLRLNSDGTTTATSPYGQVLHSHSPPRQAA
jgi:hypothetical protein